jgi:creatinine amidohydrolase
MPMATDQVFADYFSRALAENTDALIWPTLTYGAYPAFVAYAGSISLNDQTFTALVTEIADAIIDFGAKSLFILDTGLSTIAPFDAAIPASRHPSRVRHITVFRGPHFLATARNLMRQPYGSHADEIETSLMLAIAPELVDMTRARASPFPATAQRLDRFRPTIGVRRIARQAEAMATRRWRRLTREHACLQLSSKI